MVFADVEIEIILFIRKFVYPWANLYMVTANDLTIILRVGEFKSKTKMSTTIFSSSTRFLLMKDSIF